MGAMGTYEQKGTYVREDGHKTACASIGSEQVHTHLLAGKSQNKTKVPGIKQNSAKQAEEGVLSVFGSLDTLLAWNNYTVDKTAARVQRPWRS